MCRHSNLSCVLDRKYYFSVVEPLVQWVILLSSIFFDDVCIEELIELLVLKSYTFRSTSFIKFDQVIP